MSWAAAGGFAAPIAGGLIGQHQSQGDKRRAEARLQQAYDQWGNLVTPSYSEIGHVNLENMDQVSGLSPEIAELVQQGPSAMQGISLDPNMRAAQLAALDQLGDISQTGMGDVDRARLAQIQMQTDGAAKGQREAIMQGMQARGMGGSGMELMAQLQNQQASAQQANMGGLQVAGDAQMRALDALYNRANLAGSMEQADFGRQAQTAQAQDAISRMNADFRMQHGTNRANTLNDAQQRNQQLQQQQIAARNQNKLFNQVDRVGMNNQTRAMGFGDQVTKTQGQTGAGTNIGAMYGQRAQDTQQMWSGVGQGAGQAATAYATNQKAGT